MQPQEREVLKYEFPLGGLMKKTKCMVIRKDRNNWDVIPQGLWKVLEYRVEIMDQEGKTISLRPDEFTKLIVNFPKALLATIFKDE
jgi:hypothetical protein